MAGEEADCQAIGIENYNLSLQIGSIFIILGVSILGVMIPIAGRFFPVLKVGDYTFVVFKSFGIGVILATGFIHMLTPSFNMLSSPCLQPFWGEYEAWTGLFALLGVYLVQSIQSFALSLKNKGTESGSSSTMDSENPKIDDKYDSKLATFLLEAGVVVHSIIIGITLGVTGGSEFVGLLAAISFHQFFEGFALGTVAVDSNFRSLGMPIFLGVIYSLTTPLGQAIGIALSSNYMSNSSASLLSQGILEAISGGILIYDGLVNLLTPSVTGNVQVSKLSVLRRIPVHVSLFLGSAAMAIIGKWA